MNRRLIICLIGASILAGAGPRRPVRRPPPPPPDSVMVTPSDAIEIRVALEVDKAEDIMEHLSADNAFSSAFLVSAIYYHDGFLDGYPANRPDVDPTSRIDALILQAMPRGFKARYFNLLRSLCPVMDRTPMIRPVTYEPPPPPGRGPRRIEYAHDDALDMFVDEGTPIESATGGLVIEAETGWKGDDPFSTSAVRGGNEAIVFDPVSNRFYRYCHMQAVLVRVGQVVEAGDFLGTVGHTGFNAVLPGHGQHLHFEINRVDGGATRSFTRAEIQEFLRTAEGPL
ncbi:MAG TPA: M23 family metallopeptidase [Bryobacteraceae bacterium]|nr:M23 family metallopeptidase [Bryobacteraceae bacterium]